MATIELAAEPRAVIGKKVKQLRRAGIVPANIYGGHVESAAIQAPVLELRHALRAAGGTGLVRISLGRGAPVTAIVRRVQREATTGNVVHVDFQRVLMTEKMQLRIPLVLAGRAPISDADGVVILGRDTLDVECLPGDIPQHFEVDVSGMVASDSVIHVRDLAVPDDVVILTDPDVVVASVTMVSSEEAAAAVGEAGEEPVEATPQGESQG